ncbi:MAG: primase-helicase family protein [Beijerinckiaceae bacterium]
MHRAGGEGPDDGGGRWDDTLDGIIEMLNEEYALILMGSRAVIMREKPLAPVEDRARVLSLEAFKAYFHNKGSTVWKRIKQPDGSSSSQKTYVKWALSWLAHRNRRTYDGIEFFPDPENAPGTPNYFNIWRGFGRTPDTLPPEERRLKYKTFRDHLFTNICCGDRRNFEWVFAWCAHIAQRPRERIGTGIVLRGKMGTGKTKVGEIIGSLFPSHYFLVDDPRYVTGRFNAHMASCLLLQVDEGFWAGDKAAEGRLKGLATAPKQMIEAKGVDPIRLDNFVRLLFSSNEDWVIPAALDERRFCVLDVAPDVAQMHEYFAEMDREMDNGGREALLADLLALDLDAPGSPNLRVIPKTAALLEQKLRSLDAVSSWWFERLESMRCDRYAVR